LIKPLCLHILSVLLTKRSRDNSEDSDYNETSQSELNPDKKFKQSDGSEGNSVASYVSPEVVQNEQSSEQNNSEAKKDSESSSDEKYSELQQYKESMRLKTPAELDAELYNQKRIRDKAN